MPDRPRLIRSREDRVVAVMRVRPLAWARPFGPLPLRVAFLMSALATLAGPASAHEYWLTPRPWLARPGTVVEVGACAGTGFRGERKPYASMRAIRFVARAARDLDLTRAASDGELIWARFAPSDPGGAMLAYESGYSTITLAAPEFDAYLAQEGLVAPLAARRRAGGQRPGRERYRRCAKAWLAGTEPTRATRAIGLPLEIVPLVPPGAGRALRVRVLWNGRPLAGSLVKAWHTPLDAHGVPGDPETRDSVAVEWKARMDARGETQLQVTEPGEWLLSVVHMIPSRDPSADWESTWASLVFQMPGREGETR